MTLANDDKAYMFRQVSATFISAVISKICALLLGSMNSSMNGFPIYVATQTLKSTIVLPCAHA